VEFLQTLAPLYNIFIFTASSYAYASAILGYLDPTSSLIQGFLSRNNCLQTKNGFYIKDLRIIKNRELKNTLIVDNLAHSFGFQIENGVPILEWHNEEKDMELFYLTNYLKEAANYEDVRIFNRQRLKLMELARMSVEELGI
jgi:CTD small phosphatase-like protein 2